MTDTAVKLAQKVHGESVNSTVPYEFIMSKEGKTPLINVYSHMFRTKNTRMAEAMDSAFGLPTQTE